MLKLKILKLSYFPVLSRFLNHAVYVPLWLLFLWLWTLRTGEDYFYAQRAGLMFSVALLVATIIWRRFDPLTGIVAGYTFFSAVYSSYWRANLFAMLGTEDLILERAVFLGTLSTLAILFCFFTDYIKQAFFKRILIHFGLFLCLHFWWLKHIYAPDGHMMTHSVSGIYLVMLSPFVAFPIQLIFWVTALATKSYSAWLALGGVLAGLYFRRKHLWYWVLGGVIGVIVAKYSLSWVKWEYGQGRYVVWKYVLLWMSELPIAQKIFGLGAGTAYTLVPIIQGRASINIGGSMTYLHNEYLQIFFELGALGMLLYLAFYLHRLYASWRSAPSRAFLFALAASSVALFPLRHETLLFLTFFGLKETFRASKKEAKFEV